MTERDSQCGRRCDAGLRSAEQEVTEGPSSYGTLHPRRILKSAEGTCSMSHDGELREIWGGGEVPKFRCLVSATAMARLCTVSMVLCLHAPALSCAFSHHMNMASWRRAKGGRVRFWKQSAAVSPTFTIHERSDAEGIRPSILCRSRPVAPRSLRRSSDSARPLRCLISVA